MVDVVVVDVVVVTVVAARVGVTSMGDIGMPNGVVQLCARMCISSGYTYTHTSPAPVDFVVPVYIAITAFLFHFVLVQSVLKWLHHLVL